MRLSVVDSSSSSSFLLAKRLVDQVELATSFAQTRHHVIEDFGEVADFAATRCFGQVHCEIASRDFTGALREPVERPRDKKSESIRERGDENEQQRDHDQREIPEVTDLRERGLGRDLGDHEPS